MDDVKKFMEKKLREQGGPRHSARTRALASVSDTLSKMLGGDDAERIKDSMKMAKVTVASDSKEGLKKGLQKSEDLLEDMPMDGESEESESEKEEYGEEEESDEEMSSSEHKDSMDELKSQIEQLKQELENLKKRA